MNIRIYKTAKLRRKALEDSLHLNLPNTAHFSLDEQVVAKKHCENMIGVTQIPMGIAGPLIVEDKEYYIPLTTTEGALVASISRGCKAVSLSGGVSICVSREGQTRGPVFFVASIKKGKEVSQWIEENTSLMEETAKKTSRYISMQQVVVKSVGQYVFVRFGFDTKDAMGMNMVTIATEEIANLIEKENGVTCLSVAGNYDSDKKASWLNFINNRGFQVGAETVIKKEIVQKVLKTTPQQLFEVWLAKCMIGSAMSGSMGFNGHYANVIAALFIATGQDPAHVVEGSMGVTTMKVLANGDLYVSIYLPALIVGTVGGGTGLSTQNEALQILGAAGDGKVEKFAGIIGGAVLAGELSLLASLAEGSLVTAHQRLGRGEK